MKLISEEICPEIEPLCEETEDGDKSWYVEGIFAQAEVPNGNRRIYPAEHLIPEAERFIESKVKKNQAVGELDHPTYPEPKLRYASHKIESLTIDGNNIKGRARIIEESQFGRQTIALIKAGVQLGVSTRGLGTVSEAKGGVSKVNKDYKLMTVDIVGNPSAPDAYVNGIMESVEYLYEEGYGIRKVDLDQMVRTPPEDKVKLFRQLIHKL